MTKKVLKVLELQYFTNLTVFHVLGYFGRNGTRLIMLYWSQYGTGARSGASETDKGGGIGPRRPMYTILYMGPTRPPWVHPAADCSLPTVAAVWFFFSSAALRLALRLQLEPFTGIA